MGSNPRLEQGTLFRSRSRRFCASSSSSPRVNIEAWKERECGKNGLEDGGRFEGERERERQVA